MWAFHRIPEHEKQEVKELFNSSDPDRIKKIKVIYDNYNVIPPGGCPGCQKDLAVSYATLEAIQQDKI